MSYSHRIADLQLAERLEAFGAVLIEGPKWCGKTTTAEQMSKSVIKMQDTEMQEEYAATAASKPSLLLMGETPRLIDEWQDAPVLWDPCVLWWTSVRFLDNSSLLDLLL